MDDCPAVYRLLHELDDLHVRIRPDVFQPFDDPEQQRERVAGFVDADDAELFVAEMDDSIVGLATVRVASNPDAPMFRSGRRALMDDLFVAPDQRRSGIAQMLLERIKEWTQSRDLPTLDINVWNANDSGVAFFTASGFAPRCQQMELKFQKPSQPHDAR